MPKAKAFHFWAQNRVYYCSIAADPVDFGTISDAELSGKVLKTKIQANCERPFITGITLFPLEYGAYCMVIKGNAAPGAAEGTRYLVNSSDPESKIYFSFYNDAAAGSRPIGEDFGGKYAFLSGSPYINIGANFFGSFTMDFPVIVRLFSSRIGGKDGSIAAGDYSGIFVPDLYYGALYPLSSSWQAKSAADCTGLPKGPETTQLTVRARVSGSCNVAVENHIDFGQIPPFRLREGFSAPEGRIKAYCSKGTNYQIGLSPGLHRDKAMAGSRAMQRSGGGGAQDFVAYNLYKDSAHTEPWTDAWGSFSTQKNAGSGEWQSYPVYGFIPPQDSDKNSGLYTDTVIVEVRVTAQ